MNLIVGLCFFAIASSFVKTTSVESASGLRFDVSSTAKSSNCTIQIAVLTRELAALDGSLSSMEDD